MGLPTLPIPKRPELNGDKLFWMKLNIMKQQKAYCIKELLNSNKFSHWRYIKEIFLRVYTYQLFIKLILILFLNEQTTSIKKFVQIKKNMFLVFMETNIFVFPRNHSVAYTKFLLF